MKLLITGATGLVGKALIKKSLSQGTEIHFLTTQKAKINKYSVESIKMNDYTSLACHWLTGKRAQE